MLSIQRYSITYCIYSILVKVPIYSLHLLPVIAIS